MGGQCTLPLSVLCCVMICIVFRIAGQGDQSGESDCHPRYVGIVHRITVGIPNPKHLVLGFNFSSPYMCLYNPNNNSR